MKIVIDCGCLNNIVARVRIGESVVEHLVKDQQGPGARLQENDNPHQEGGTKSSVAARV